MLQLATNCLGAFCFLPTCLFRGQMIIAFDLAGYFEDIFADLFQFHEPHHCVILSPLSTQRLGISFHWQTALLKHLGLLINWFT